MTILHDTSARKLGNVGPFEAQAHRWPFFLHKQNSQQPVRLPYNLKT
jgi:hypothetical protein